MFKHLAILAPGLLGGSVAMAAHARNAVGRITVWARRSEVRNALQGQPWVNHVADTPETAVADADIVVIAAPVEKIIELVAQIAPFLKKGAIVTDVGSVKTRICQSCTSAMPSHAVFVGSHPMAGSQKTGWENGSATLFENATVFITPTEPSNSQGNEAAQILGDFWKQLGAKNVAVTSPADHDQIVAHISHLPQSLATALCALLARKNPVWRDYAGNGLRDTTRIAASDANMWMEIFQQNREPLLDAIRGYQNTLTDFHDALAAENWDQLRALFERGKNYREGFRS